ncbi:MAG: superoxide dismutase [Gammaproteobacteria bacterium]|nr:MAG: superoxide dismutase [Gammaproteobacteria bacterium]
MAFEFPDLPYDFTALEPSIDARTMEIHYDRHHRTYFKNFTDKVDGTPLADKSLEEVMKSIDASTDKAIRNNGGGYYNHIMYWNSMCHGGSAPSSAFEEAVKSAFGSMDELRAKLKAAGIGQFGSGFAWLIVRDGKLEVTSTPNQDNPLMPVAEVQGTPILGLDVWEHAYYLKFQNKRPDYIDEWFSVVDWASTSERFAAV